MGIRLSIVIFSLFVNFMISPAIAAADKEVKYSLILSGGRSIAVNSCESPWVSIMDAGYECSESNKIFRIAINYKFSPTWGMEFSGGDIADSRTVGTYLTRPYSWQMKADGITLAGIAHLHVSKGFSLFGKLGVVRIQISEKIGTISATGTAQYGQSYNGVPTTSVEKYSPTAGIGFQYDFENKIGLRLQYEYFGQYDIYSLYGVSEPERIRLSALTAGLVVSY